MQSLCHQHSGEWVGTALGPPETQPALDFALPPVNHVKRSTTSNTPSQAQGVLCESTIYPAASIYSSNQTLTIMPAGHFGSIVLPIELSMQKTVTAVVSRLSAKLLIGTAVDQQEETLLPWLRSPLFIAGFDTTISTSADSNSLNKLAIGENDWTSDFMHTERLLLSQEDQYLQFDLPEKNESPEKKFTKTLGTELSSTSSANNDLHEFILKLGDTMTSTALPSSSSSAATDLTSGSSGSSSVDDDIYLLIIRWFESFEKLQAVHSTRFPICERAVIAALLKHSGTFIHQII